MNFQCSIDINVPIDKVIALFNDPGNFREWQDGFVSYEPISGIPRTVGAKSKINFDTGRHKIELIETIQVMNLPEEMTALYEHKHMVNTMINRFTELPGQKTRFTTDMGYYKFIGFMSKFMALMMPGMFKKQNQKWLAQFKMFAEREYPNG